MNGKGRDCVTGAGFLICICMIVLSLLIETMGCKPGSTPSNVKGPVTLNVSVNLKLDSTQEALENLTAEFEKEHPDTRVHLIFMRRDEQYKKILESSQSSDDSNSLDVVMADLIWIPELASKKLICPLNPYLSRDMLEDLHPSLKESFTYRGKLWAMPLRCYFQLFFFNSEILSKAGFSKPPSTIEEWEKQMEVIKNKQIVKYPLIDSWSQQEALICEFVWMTGAYGGDLFSVDGLPVFHKGPGVEALKTMVRWLQKGFINPLSLAADENMVKDIFMRGTSAYTTNWISQCPVLIDSHLNESLKVGLIPVSRNVFESIPAHTTSVSGFQGLAIMQSSRHGQRAWEYIWKIGCPESYEFYADEYPVWISTQKNEKWRKTDPFWDLKKDALESIHHRPRLQDYDATTHILQKYLHLALEQRLPPEEALNKAADEIAQMKYPFSKLSK